MQLIDNIINAKGGLIDWQPTIKSGTGSNDIGTENHDLTFLLAADPVQISSSSANDTAAGTGARTVKVDGLDQEYNPISEVVTMNGQTAVALVQDFRRINSLEVVTAGSGNVNAGAIYISPSGATLSSGQPSATADRLAVINASKGKSQMAHFTIRAGHVALITGLNMEPSNAISLLYRLGNGAWKSLFETSIELRNYDIPIPFGEKTDIRFYDSGSASVIYFITEFGKEDLSADYYTTALGLERMNTTFKVSVDLASIINATNKGSILVFLVGNVTHDGSVVSSKIANITQDGSIALLEATNVTATSTIVTT
jgi:hypothetical protein